MYEVIATVSIFGVTQLGLLIWTISALVARIDNHKDRIEKLEEKVFLIGEL